MTLLCMFIILENIEAEINRIGNITIIIISFISSIILEIKQ